MGLFGKGNGEKEGLICIFLYDILTVCRSNPNRESWIEWIFLTSQSRHWLRLLCIAFFAVAYDVNSGNFSLLKICFYPSTKTQVSSLPLSFCWMMAQLRF
jgi:hypothetical protein